MKRLLLLYCLCLPFGLYAQDYPAHDSLLMVDTLQALNHLESKYSTQTDPEQMVRSGLKIVDHYIHVTGETDKAVSFANDLEPYVLKRIPEMTVSIEMARAKAYDYAGIFDRAAEHYLKVIDLGKEQEQLELVAVASSNLGILYKFQGQLDQALKYNRLALTYDSLIGDRIGLAADFNNLAGSLRKESSWIAHCSTTERPI